MSCGIGGGSGSCGASWSRSLPKAPVASASPVPRRDLGYSEAELRRASPGQPRPELAHQSGPVSVRSGKRSKRLSGADPNFSVILPGGCQAKCDFCFWSHERSPEWWLEKLHEIVGNLPKEYRRVSVSGGEPTASKVFGEALAVLSGRKWDAVVLTTNGLWWKASNGAKVLGLINKYVDHVNVSRHAVPDDVNDSRFGCKMPTEEELTDMAAALVPDVNLNCVMSRDWAQHEVENYVDMAKRVGAGSVCFRRDQRHGNTDPPESMKFFRTRHASPDPECPVCRVWIGEINGMRVAWKSSVPEPSIVMGETYELVYHQNGRLSDDWAGEQLVTLKSTK